MDTAVDGHVNNSGAGEPGEADSFIDEFGPSIGTFLWINDDPAFAPEYTCSPPPPASVTSSPSSSSSNCPATPTTSAAPDGIDRSGKRKASSTTEKRLTANGSLGRTKKLVKPKSSRTTKRPSSSRSTASLSPPPASSSTSTISPTLTVSPKPTPPPSPRPSPLSHTPSLVLRPPSNGPSNVRVRNKSAGPTFSTFSAVDSGYASSIGTVGAARTVRREGKEGQRSSEVSTLGPHKKGHDEGHDDTGTNEVESIRSGAEGDEALVRDGPGKAQVAAEKEAPVIKGALVEPFWEFSPHPSTAALRKLSLNQPSPRRSSSLRQHRLSTPSFPASPPSPHPRPSVTFAGSVVDLGLIRPSDSRASSLRSTGSLSVRRLRRRNGERPDAIPERKSSRNVVLAAGTRSKSGVKMPLVTKATEVVIAEDGESCGCEVGDTGKAGGLGDGAKEGELSPSQLGWFEEEERGREEGRRREEAWFEAERKLEGLVIVENPEEAKEAVVDGGDEAGKEAVDGEVESGGEAGGPDIPSEGSGEGEQSMGSSRDDSKDDERQGNGSADGDGHDRKDEEKPTGVPPTEDEATPTKEKGAADGETTPTPQESGSSPNGKASSSTLLVPPSSSQKPPTRSKPTAAPAPKRPIGGPTSLKPGFLLRLRSAGRSQEDDDLEGGADAPDNGLDAGERRPFHPTRPPTQVDLKRALGCAIVDMDGRAAPFRSLFSAPPSFLPSHPSGSRTSTSTSEFGAGARRSSTPLPTASGEGGPVVAIFVRFWNCGYCQEYGKQLSRVFARGTEARRGLEETRTRVAIIGTGSWKMMRAWREVVGWEGPVYTDPTSNRALFKALGMTRNTLAMGKKSEKGEYLRYFSTSQMVRNSTVNAFKMPMKNPGSFVQLGGEFCFATVDTLEEADPSALLRLTLNESAIADRPEGLEDRFSLSALPSSPNPANGTRLHIKTSSISLSSLKRRSLRNSQPLSPRPPVTEQVGAAGSPRPSNADGGGDIETGVRCLYANRMTNSRNHGPFTPLFAAAGVEVPRAAPKAGIVNGFGSMKRTFKTVL